MKGKEINDMTNLKDIPNIELVNELKRRLDQLDLINIKDNTPTHEELEQIPQNKNNSELVGRMTNNPARHEYNLMGEILGLYENNPKNLLGFEEKNINGSKVLFTFLKTYPDYYKGLEFNKREQERIQLTFDEKRFDGNLEPIKDKLKAGTVIKVFGRLNNTVNQKTGGRSFSVYSFTDFPEKIINFNNSPRGQPP
jgi:hypothetical protein